jgi:hypothetical protein
MKTRSNGASPKNTGTHRSELSDADFSANVSVTNNVKPMEKE